MCPLQVYYILKGGYRDWKNEYLIPEPPMMIPRDVGAVTHKEVEDKRESMRESASVMMVQCA